MSIFGDSEGAADAIADLLQTLPDGTDFYGFLIHRDRVDGTYSAMTLGTCHPRDVLPAIRDWVARIEAGAEPTVHRTGGGPLQ